MVLTMTEKRKKRKAPERGETEEDALARSLAAYGERFMQMFEDADQYAAKAARGAGGQRRPAPEASSDSDAGYSEDEGASSDDEDASSSGRDSDNKPDEAGAVEFVFDSRGVVHKQQQQQRGPKVKQKNRAAGSAAAAAAVAAATAVDARLERKAFMSSKAARVHAEAPAAAAGGGSAGGVGGRGAEAGDGLSREEFLQMQREVEMYGAAALDKRSRRRYEAAMLARLGAKAQKSPRIPAKIGLGMAKKAAQRDAKALEEAIDAGMVKRKGLGRKRREEKRQAQALDRGLMEDRGAFRAGVLRVRLGAGGKGGGGRGGGGGGRGGGRKKGR